MLLELILQNAELADHGLHGVLQIVDDHVEEDLVVGNLPVERVHHFFQLNDPRLGVNVRFF